MVTCGTSSRVIVPIAKFSSPASGDPSAPKSVANAVALASGTGPVTSMNTSSAIRISVTAA